MVEPLFIVYKQIDIGPPPNDDILFISTNIECFLVRESKYTWSWLDRQDLVRESIPLKPLTIGEIREYLISEFGYSEGTAYAPQFVQDHGMLVNGDKLRPEQYQWLVRKRYVWSL